MEIPSPFSGTVAEILVKPGDTVKVGDVMMRFSNGEVAACIDPLAIDDLSCLGPMMADPDVVKVFHGADYDITSLKRDFGYTISPVFDTMIVAQALGIERFSLADLAGTGPA